MRKAAAVLSLVVLLALPVAATTFDAIPWNIDVPHTEVNFKVRHFFTPVTGTFSDYEIELMFDKEDPTNSSVNAVVQIASVSTGNERRDNHLRTDDWFGAGMYGQMTFESTSVRKTGMNEFVAVGNLTIKETTKQVELPFQLLGIQAIPEQMREMLGGVTQVASFQANLMIDRTEFGVGTGMWAETAVVGSDVEIELLVEANIK
ncbi:MAG: polyisoprenoid-binding protein [Acidobacteria bacterium]|nr:polyisoprenoid-binding protein [Acidobacteriota bacterium]